MPPGHSIVQGSVLSELYLQYVLENDLETRRVRALSQAWPHIVMAAELQAANPWPWQHAGHSMIAVNPADV